jgi:threonylcarbamoyladenosine tRNA methylthiotransferase MtaB
LKVQDGCDYNCSFCTIPKARGRSRSDSIANVVKNARQLAEKGIREIVLTGVNLGDFGDTQGIENFYRLITELDQVDGIDRFRISSIEPNLLTDEIIGFVAKSEKFMPHFHIPLQSGSNEVLGLMRRRYRKEFYRARVKHIKNLMPHCAIGADVIVGFPGEKEENFKETHEFLQELGVSYLHVFTYSERNGTKALEIKPVVPVQVRQERNKVLRNLSFLKIKNFRKQHEGQTRRVLFENPSKNGTMEGFTDNYIRITTSARKEWINRLVDWVL